MALDTKVIMSKVKNKVSVFINGSMAPNMKVNGMIIKYQEKEHIPGLTEENIKVNGNFNYKI